MRAAAGVFREPLEDFHSLRCLVLLRSTADAEERYALRGCREGVSIGIFSLVSSAPASGITSGGFRSSDPLALLAAGAVEGAVAGRVDAYTDELRRLERDARNEVRWEETVLDEFPASLRSASANLALRKRFRLVVPLDLVEELAHERHHARQRRG